jgi:hypothetical protein
VSRPNQAEIDRLKRQLGECEERKYAAGAAMRAAERCGDRAAFQAAMQEARRWVNASAEIVARLKQLGEEMRWGH